MAEPADKPPQEPGSSGASNPPQMRVLHSRDLLQGERQVLIDHEGALYRLQVTRNGRLILQK